ncbi:hypothetical protein CCACVL1_29407 [Corchorus capsularis]|uniref:Nudix hydrolase domain-containing protein n=1 Tax=Corchorus capsularis TaxID=210143 RepID=A0A1R3G1U0_COCAP|nr:hypothetical protein CCACVL1_29407 [Corchorus capsularis]
MLTTTKFPTPESLSEWLKLHIPEEEMNTWGVKPVPPTPHCQLRTVNCVVVRIQRPDGTILLESSQEMSNGSKRQRNRPLSEKLKANENDVVATTLRAVKEKLGSAENHETCGSYPGLSTRYIVTYVDAFVGDLPEEEFYKAEDEYAEYGDEMAAKTVTVKKHFWKWFTNSDPLLFHA